MRTISSLTLALAIALMGCGEKDGEGETEDANMTPGEDCLPCHSDFSIGGTVYPGPHADPTEGIEGVTVSILDANQKTLTLISNAAGNFYSREPIAWPAEVSFTLGSRSAVMLSAPSGNCGSGSCHRPKLQGYVYLP